MIRPVKGFEDKYQVSDDGRVYKIDGTELNYHYVTRGYKTVSLCKDKRTHTKLVHRLVAEAFIPNPDNLPQVNHKDEDKENNTVSNLEWCTNYYNIHYGTGNEKRRASGLKGAIKRGECKEVICLADGKRYYSISEAARHYGFCASRVSFSCIYKRGGEYPFRYYSEYKEGVI